MANDGTIKIGIQFETNAKKLKSELSTVSNTAKSAFSGVGGIVKSGFDAALTSITAASTALSAFGGYAVNVGTSFEKSMSKVMATMGITKDTIADGANSYEILKQAAEAAGENTVFTASQAADALNYLALAGYDAKKAADVLPSVLNLATAGNMDLAYASDLATDAMAALSIEANNANLTRFGDEMAKTASSANTNVAQLGEAIIGVGGTAKDLKGGTVELDAALGVLANRGIKGAEAGHKLRNMLISLSDPIDTASAAMQNIGLDVFDAEGNMRSLGDIFYDLQQATKDMSGQDRSKLFSAIFNRYDLAAAQALTAGAGKEFEQLYEKIDNCDGSMQQMADTMKDNLNGELKSLSSKAEALGIAVYDHIQLPLRNLAEMGGEYLTQLKKSFEDGGFQGLASSFGQILAEIITMGANKLPDFLGMGSEMMASVANGLLENADVLSDAAINAIMAIPDFLINNMAVFLEIGSIVVSKLSEGVLNNADKLSEAAVSLVSSFARFIINSIPEVAKAAKQMIQAFADTIAEEVPQLEPFADAIKTLTDNFIPLAKIIGVTLLSIKGFKIIKSLIGIIIPVITAIKGITSASALFNSVIGALGVAGGPVGAAIAVIGTLAGAVGMLSLAFRDEKTDLEKAMEVSRKHSEQLDKDMEKLRDMKKGSEDAADAEMIQIEKTQDLWEELENLADSSGRVKDSDKIRADYILGELNTALGTEYRLVDNQIQKYDELKGSIDELIEKKRAEALLTAYQDTYTEALKQQAEAEKEYIDAYNNRAELMDQKETFESRLRQAGYDGDINALRDKGALVQQQYDISADDLDNYFEVIDALNEGNEEFIKARQKLDESATFVSQYEKAENAAQAGDYDAVDDFLQYQYDESINWADKENQEEQRKAKEKYDNLLLLRDEARRNGREDDAKAYQEAADELLLEAKKSGWKIGDVFGEEARKRINEIISSMNIVVNKPSQNQIGFSVINSPGDASLLENAMDEIEQQQTSRMDELKNKFAELENAYNENIELDGDDSSVARQKREEMEQVVLDAAAIDPDIRKNFGDTAQDIFNDLMMTTQHAFDFNDLIPQNTSIPSVTNNSSSQNTTNVTNYNNFTVDPVDITRLAEMLYTEKDINSYGKGGY